MRKTCTLLMSLLLAAEWALAAPAGPDEGAAGQALTTATFSVPLAAAGQDLGSGAGSGQEQPAPQPTKPSPISGSEVLTPGGVGLPRSYVLPAMACTEHGDTNPTGFSAHADLVAESSCLGNLTLQLVGRHSQFNLDNTGGGYVFGGPFPPGTPAGTNRYGFFDDLGFSEQVTGRRWEWLLEDHGMYLPDTPDGFLGFAGLTSFDSGMGANGLSYAPAMNSSFEPNQGIYTGLSRRLADLATTEIQYTATPRSTITATGMFGTVQFLSSGFISNRYWVFTPGYTRFFGRGDQFAISYQEYHSNSGPLEPLFVNRGVSVLYGHRINGKFSFQVSLAPTANQIALPGKPAPTNIFWATFDTLQYRHRQWDADASFSRQIRGGSGILAGADFNVARGGMGRQLTRRLHGALEVDFDANRALIEEAAGEPLRDYRLWKVGGELSEEFGPHLSMYVNYYSQRQSSNVPLCLASNCGTDFYRQIAGIGLNWHARPMRVE